MQKILFIVNPLSIDRKNVDIKALLNNCLDLNRYQYDLALSEYHGHAYELARKNIGKYDILVAVGGDGTLNQVSRTLVNTDIPLGIIPLGSGNGLARELKIPLNPANAIKKLNNPQFKKIDTGTVNDYHFINMAGIGFDASIAHAFSFSEIRGFKTYLKVAAKKYLTFKPENVILNIDGEQHSILPFILSIANSGQYGNNAYISPSASFEDGLFDICVVKTFPFRQLFIMAGRLFLKNIYNSKYFDIYKSEHFIVEFDKTIEGHIDGEPVLFEKKIDVQINKKALNVIIPYTK